MSTETKVKERPILFSGPMVRAILEGRKTQTRRIVKPQPESMHHDEVGYELSMPNCRPLYPDSFCKAYCKFGRVGERLWVRESHAIYRDAFAREKGDEVILYRADASAYWNMTPHNHMEAEFNPLRDTSDYEPKWTPSIHMPRWASRITLEITAVRVQRLNDLTNADAVAEGMAKSHPSIDKVSQSLGYEDFSRSMFAQLWDSLYFDCPWESNPWVWVIDFQPLKNL